LVRAERGDVAATGSVVGDRSGKSQLTISSKTRDDYAGNAREIARRIARRCLLNHALTNGCQYGSVRSLMCWRLRSEEI
jgi:hypothetical protein